MLTRDKYIKSPVEIESELLHFFKKTDPLIIFDIGACEAEDSIRYSLLFPNSRVFAFEPRKDNCKKAADLISQYGIRNIVVENIALSNENGFADFHLSEGEPEGLSHSENWNYGNKSSSLLAPSEEMKKHTGWLSFKNKIQVRTQTLKDYVAEKNIPHLDFVHLDVQGAEYMVLEGCGNFIDKIKLIWMEVEAVELYKDQPLKEDIQRFMEKSNFVNILDTVNQVSGDQLYVNRNLFSEGKINSIPTKRKSLSLIARLKSLLKI